MGRSCVPWVEDEPGQWGCRVRGSAAQAGALPSRVRASRAAACCTRCPAPPTQHEALEAADLDVLADARNRLLDHLCEQRRAAERGWRQACHGWGRGKGTAGGAQLQRGSLPRRLRSERRPCGSAQHLASVGGSSAGSGGERAAQAAGERAQPPAARTCHGLAGVLDVRLLQQRHGLGNLVHAALHDLLAAGRGQGRGGQRGWGEWQATCSAVGAGAAAGSTQHMPRKAPRSSTHHPNSHHPTTTRLAAPTACSRAWP